MQDIEDVRSSIENKQSEAFDDELNNLIAECGEFDWYKKEPEAFNGMPVL